MAPPPNYTMTFGEYVPMCLICKYYEKSRCTRYNVVVGNRNTCDDWKRDMVRWPPKIV